MSKTRKTPAADAVVTTFRQKLLLVAFGLGLAVLALALVEGALALFSIGDEALYDDPFVGFAPGKDLFEKKTVGGREVYATRPEKLAFFNAQQFPAEKSSRAYRIFALGGSTTAGRPYDDKVAFCRWLGLYLNAMDPSRDWQAVNAGAISYASYRIVVLMKELVRYEPDLFVIYTGHNEFLEERSYSDVVHRNPALTRLQAWLGGWRFYALARRGVLAVRERGREGGETLGSEVRTRLDGWTGLELYHRDDELKRSILAHFEHNLHQMVRIARRSGARVVFVKPVSNLKDFSPFKSEHPADLGRREVERFAAHLTRGRALLADDPQAALEAFAEARAIDPEHAALHFYTGRAHFARRGYDAALDAFLRAKDLDVAPLRALEPIAELVAEAARRERLPLVDLPAILAARGRERFGHPIPGDEVMLDHVHPDVPVHSLIAERVIAELVAAGVARRAAAWTPATRQALYDEEIAGFDRAYYAERDLNLAKVLGWAGKLEEAEAPLERAAAVLPDHPEVRMNLGIVYQKTGRLEAAARELERAVALDPDSPEARFNLGGVYGRLGRPEEGAAAHEQAIRLRPEYPEAFYNLGVLRSSMGAFERAAAALERARQLKPGAPEVLSHLAQAYRGQGRFDDAVATLRRALELEPGDAATRTALGVAYGRQGRLDDAVRELRRVIADHPSFAEAHYNLGVVYSQQDDDARAEAAFLAALGADPDHVEALNNLGILHAGRGDLETARRHLVKAIQLDPDYADAYFNLGVVYDQAGLPEEAGRVLERAVELAPENPRFHFALAMMHYARGRWPEAREHFAAARRGGVETPAEVLREIGSAEQPRPRRAP